METFDRRAAWPSLLQLAHAAVQRPLLLGAFALGGALAGIAAGQMLPARYEAVALMRMAQIGVKEGKDSRLVESAVEAAERMRMRGFAQDALGDGDLVNRIVAKRIGLSEQLIEVRFRDGSQQAAEQGMQKIFDLLRTRQEDLARPGRERLAEEVRSMQRLRADAQGRRQAGMQAFPASAAAGVRPEMAFVQSPLFAQDFQVAQWQGVVETALASPATLPTTLLEPIRVDDQPVSPKKTLLVLAGLVAGTLLGAFASLLLFLRGRRG